MITALLLTILPTLLFYILLPKIGIQIKSPYLKCAFSWFAGMYLFTICTFLLAVLLSFFTSSVLLKATYTSLILVQIILLFFAKDVGTRILSLKQTIKRFFFPQPVNLFLVLFCLLFSFFFYTPHLTIQDQKIYTSPIYWDFHWHVGLIQNFAYGDNFPPVNESFSGVPHTYHYFWGVLTAMYEVGGLDLVTAINFVSILGFFFILIAIIGCSEEFFRSKGAGTIAVLLMITSSSWHALYYFSKIPNDQNLFETIVHIATNTQHLFRASLVQGDIYNYVGVFFNLFYFLEERQMIFGVVYLLLCTWIIYRREQLSNPVLFCLGLCMGAYFLWHLYIAIMVLCALIFVAVFGGDRKKTLFLLLGFCLTFGALYLYFKQLITSPWFYPTITQFPKINLEFAGGEYKPFSFGSFIDYYNFSYGSKIFFFIASCVLLWIKNKKLFLTLIAIVLPTFLLVNTIQLSPAVISENHKWLRPMNVIVDLAVAFILYKAFFSRKKIALIALGVVFLFMLTISGIIELMPFLNSKPTQYYASYPSPLTTAIRQQSPQQATFIGGDLTEIQLAGRRVFTGDTLGGNMQFKKAERKRIINEIYTAQSITAFCNLTRSNSIDYVEFIAYPVSLKKPLQNLPHFTSINDQNEPVLFIDTKNSCKSKPSSVIK